ncbi:uncharacterized protein LOC124932385 [Impatiens glandulifera]|uniref:uncharacterized protein LOC124932385 n=1 Tax=Impatiens glandulifera TaxID=253017 RepID=UPI001FB10D05|nr:uncharacterized protein LOC124932385 [Impatiens glandulifera]
MDAEDQPITVDNDDVHVTPPKEINGLISETVKEEEDLEIVIEEVVVEEIKSLLESTDTVIDEPDEYVSEVNNEEQSLDVALVPLPDRDYSAVTSSEVEPEAILPPLAKEEEEEEEIEVLSVKEELVEVEEKSTEAELPISSDRDVVGDCEYENIVESVEYSGGTENAGEDHQLSEVVTSNQIVHHSSWKDCCGLFDVLRRRSNQ